MPIFGKSISTTHSLPKREVLMWLANKIQQWVIIFGPCPPPHFPL